MRIIDTHAHYDDEAFDEDRGELLGKLLKEGGVELAVNMGASMYGADESAAYAEKVLHMRRNTITFMRESGFIRMTSAYSSTPAFHGKKLQNLPGKRSGTETAEIRERRLKLRQMLPRNLPYRSEGNIRRQSVFHQQTMRCPT